MPHPELGRVGWLLGGGGCVEGLPQAVQIREFWNAGIRPDYIGAFSAGAFNALDPESAVQFWTEHFHSPWAIYDLNPVIKKSLINIYKAIPAPFLHGHKGLFDFWSDLYHYKKKRYKNFKELWADIQNLKSHIKQIVASLPILSDSETPSPKDFVPLLQNLFQLIKTLELDRTESFFDPSPLIRTLKENLDFQKSFERESTLHIFARSWSQDYIFSCGKALSGKSESAIAENYKILKIESPEGLLWATMASGALWPLFAPVHIGEGIFWDSGVVNPFPIECAMDAECDTIFAFIKGYKYKQSGSLDVFSGLLESWDETARRHFLDQRKIARFRERIENRKPHFIIMPEPTHPDLDLLWISKDATEHTIKIEREATREWIKKNLGITPASD